MVATQIAARGVRDAAVLTALRAVPRHLFVPPEVRAQAYEDYPLPIGEGQTISQPYIVALMTSLLELKPGEKVLKIGTGSATRRRCWPPWRRGVHDRDPCLARA